MNQRLCLLRPNSRSSTCVLWHTSSDLRSRSATIYIRDADEAPFVISTSLESSACMMPEPAEEQRRIADFLDAETARMTDS